MRSEGKVVNLQFFSDGFKVFRGQESVLQAWPIYFKLKDLKVKEESKVFLYGCFVGNEKPDVESFTSSLCEDLNRIYENSINSSKCEQLIYPLIINFILDIPARSHFLNHTAHNGKYGCCTCNIKGQISTVRNKRIYRSTSRRVYKSKLFSVLSKKKLPVQR